MVQGFSEINFNFILYLGHVFQNFVDLCGQHGVNSPIEGQYPIRSASEHPVTGHMLTSLAVKPVGQFIVALLGTDQGKLLKVSEDSDPLLKTVMSISCGAPYFLVPSSGCIHSVL